MNNIKVSSQAVYYTNGFRVLVSPTEIRIVWLQDETEILTLWLPPVVAQALVPALTQALGQWEAAVRGEKDEAETSEKPTQEP